MTPLPHRVARREQETADTWTLELEPDGDPLADFRPGQFAMLYAFGVGEAPISVSRVPAGGGLVHTIRAVGPVTGALCDARPGDTVGVRGPFGTAWPLRGAEGRDVVLVAGGIGMAPLRPVVEHVLAHRGDFGELSVLYGGRTPDALLFAADRERWAGRPDLALHITVDAAAPAWHGRVGLVTRLVAMARMDPSNAVAMVCGPEVMMRLTVAALRDRGIDAADVHLSLERSMTCGVGHCGHCQLGPLLVCRDGPVVPHSVAEPLMAVAEL
jgi:NAD(P)H-flavin reductase